PDASLTALGRTETRDPVTSPGGSPMESDERERRPAALSRRGFVKTMGATAVATALGGAPALVRAQAREVKVGILLPVTGPLALEAQFSQNGLDLAAEEINAAGGVKALGGAKLTMLKGDTQNKVELGKSEASRLIDQGVSVIIGPFSSLVAFSLRQDTEKARTPLM